MDPGVEDIDLSDPEVLKAATTIQASFRGHQTRKDKHKKDEPKVEENNVNDELADIDLTDPELASAALKIQAGFRGHMAKKAPKADDSDISKRMKELNTDEELDIDLTDPDLNKAATKIQATFRGHQTRKTDQ